MDKRVDLPWPSWAAEAPPVWDSAADDVLVCVHVAQETHDVKTFTFAPLAPGVFRFFPGQFLTFTFNIGGDEISRCYTIASPPTRPDRVSITVKRVANGAVSNWLHETMECGAQVRALGPFGDFTSFSSKTDKYLFISGGSGITPLMCMARAYADLGLAADIVFLHFARTPVDMIFRDELGTMARRSKAFRFLPVCESDAPFESWQGYRGRISQEMLKCCARDVMERAIYTCGPTGFMHSVREILSDLDFPLERYHEESFDFAVPAPVETTDTASFGGFRVTFARSNAALHCNGTQTVLEAAREAGLKLPASCTRGLCGTCKSTLVSGRVDMTHAGGIRQREIDRGQILICCSRPLSDLVIDR